MYRKKAVIYARQSSGKEEESESITMQLHCCQELAMKHNLEIVAEFSDANCSGRLYPDGAEGIIALDIAFKKWYEGNSVEKKSRPGLRQVLNLLSSIDILVIYDMTRLYRPVQNSFLQSYIDSMLVENGVHLLTVKDGENNPSDFSDSLVTTIKSHVNDNQIRLTSEKARLAMRKLKDDGFLPTGARMYGIRYIGGKERMVEVIPEQAEVIRFAFEQTLKLKPYNWILREMNRRFMDRVGGKAFYISSFRHIITQPFYCGYMVDSHGALIEAKQMKGKAIISFNDWLKANDIVNNKQRPPQHRKNVPHPFSGIVVCGYCGAQMLVGQDGEKEFYHCITALNNGLEECRKSRVTINLDRESKKYTGLRQAIAPLLVLALYKSLEEQSVLLGMSKDLAGMKTKLNQYESRLARAADEYLEGNMTFESYHFLEEKANSRIKTLRNEILQIENASASAKANEERVNSFILHIDDLMQDRLEDHVFEELLWGSIRRILCFYDHLNIETVYGKVTLMRHMDGRFRHFPHFTYDLIHPAKKDIRLSETKIHVTYIYDKKAEKNLLIDLGVMKIFSQGISNQ